MRFKIQLIKFNKNQYEIIDFLIYKKSNKRFLKKNLSRNLKKSDQRTNSKCLRNLRQINSKIYIVNIQVIIINSIRMNQFNSKKKL